ncbi:MAG: hypothetical protein H7Y38_04515, partial [Armatimonadetes bacterium]|nr:hypothetical protein [Armatimonadota bacterium]
MSISPPPPVTPAKPAANAPSTAALNSWIETHKPTWDNLARIINTVGTGRNGVRSLARADLKSLGSLYRRTASDLSYARLRGADPSLVLYLNDLVTRAHGTVYAQKSPGWSAAWEFLTLGFPRLLRRKKWYVYSAALMMVLGAIVAAVMVAVEPA